MKLACECTYCGYKWVLDYAPTVEPSCSKCLDQNLKITDLSKTKIDYYKGSPPFPEKKVQKEKEDWVNMADLFFHGGD